MHKTGEVSINGSPINKYEFYITEKPNMTLKAEQIVIQSKKLKKKQKENRIIPNYEEYLTKGHPWGFLSSSPKINNLLKVNPNGIIYFEFN